MREPHAKPFIVSGSKLIFQSVDQKVNWLTETQNASIF